MKRILVFRRMPAATAENLACRDAGELAVVIFDLSVDDGEIDAVGELIGFRESSVVDQSRRIKDGDVGEIAGLQKAAAVEMFALSGK